MNLKIMKPFILGIIPARGGSKRLPNKNIRLLNGKPLISYIINTALKVKELSDVIVSTESEKITGIARKYGASVPFMRPKKYATDKATGNEVIIHSVKKYEKLFNKKVDIVVCLQATTPTTIVKDIENCLDLIINKNYDSAITVFKVYDRPEWCGIIDKFNKFKKYFSKNKTEEMSKIEWYMPSGGVYACKRNVYFRTKNFFTKNCGYVLIPPERNTDIDTEIDFKFAEYLIEKKD